MIGERGREYLLAFSAEGIDVGGIKVYIIVIIRLEGIGGVNIKASVVRKTLAVAELYRLSSLALYFEPNYSGAVSAEVIEVSRDSSGLNILSTM